MYLVGRYDLVAFAACPLVLGLGLAKLLALPGWRGKLLAAVAALALALPITFKLVAYFRAAPLEDASATAQLLDQNVADGDLVVFTGARGAPTVYYLHRLGHECSARGCRDERGRRYGLRLFPAERERELFPLSPPTEPARVTGSLHALQTDAREYASAGTRRAWLLLGETTVIDGRVQPGEDEAVLLSELTSAGFKTQPFAGLGSVLLLSR
ncbi:MAG: hypothetical protein QM765_06780 [Myxococcales bacterium]